MNHSLYLVAGLGKTGLSIARYLQRHNKKFIAFDTREQTPGLNEFKAEFPNTPLYLQTIPEEVIQQLSDIIASPGLSLDTPFLQLARQLNIDIYGDIECLARHITAPVIAITGTNGKSTVTTLVGEMATAAGFKVAVAGNIGTPVLDLLQDEHQYDLWVLELSSFQLDLTFSLAPVAATILNVSPDHLDRHHTLNAYIAAKQRIYHQAKTILFNREDTATIPNEKDDMTQSCISFGPDAPNKNHWGLLKKDKQIYLAKGDDILNSVDSLLIKGIHNWLNALAAAALADTVGISFDVITQVLNTFAGLEHRCQWVRTMDEVVWINDSKGTNVGATISAINGIGGSMQGKIVLIAGGQGKGADFDQLAQPIADCVRSVVLIGEDASKIAAALSHVVLVEHAASLDDAVLMAKNRAKPGDVVLLSPACASLDMFRDFNHRGEQFATAVKGL